MNTAARSTIENVIEQVLSEFPDITKNELIEDCAAAINIVYEEKEKNKEAELKLARDEVLDALSFWADTLKSWGIEVKIDPENFITAMKEAEAGPKIKKTREEVKKPNADSIIDEYLKKYRKNRGLNF